MINFCNNDDDDDYYYYGSLLFFYSVAWSVVWRPAACKINEFAEKIVKN